MELLALNTEWAVYKPGKGNASMEAFAALQDLLSVKTYSQLITFLRERTCNDFFASPSGTDFSDAYDRPERIWRKTSAAIDLKGDLNRTISHYPSIDFLDSLVIEDLRGSEVHQLNLSELMKFQDMMRKFLTIAAIALGCKAPTGLFIDIPAEDIFDKQWIRDNVGCEPNSLRTIGLKQEDAGFKHNGFLSDDVLDSGIFHQTDGYSEYQLIRDEEMQHGKYTDGFPFSIDGVIYTYSELFWPSEITKSTSNGSYEYFVTISFLDDIPVERAHLLLAGRVIEAAINSYPWLNEQADYAFPYYPDLSFDQYRFVPGKGFVERKVVDPPWWVESLFDEAVRLIVEGSISLCPVCGAPVLIKDHRGRKPKRVCSDSCKTKASNQRREAAYKYAASGMPIDRAINLIGKEYETSIRKWYKEAQAYIIPQS